MRYIEIWKDLKHARVRDIYQVSNSGKIRNKSTKKILKPYIEKNGYLSYGLCRKTKRKTVTVLVHIILASHFKSGKNHLRNQVNHIDGNKKNPKSTNLEWASQSENQKHAILLGLQPSGEDRVNAIFTNKFIEEICSFLENGYRTRDIVKYFSNKTSFEKQYLKNLISDIKKRNSWAFISNKYEIDQDCKSILQNLIISLYNKKLDKDEIYNYLTKELFYDIKPNYIKATINKVQRLSKAIY